jgi:hypothetical protein
MAMGLIRDAHLSECVPMRCLRTEGTTVLFAYLGVQKADPRLLIGPMRRSKGRTVWIVG